MNESKASSQSDSSDELDQDTTDGIDKGDQDEDDEEDESTADDINQTNVSISEADDGNDRINQSCLIQCLPTLKRYFMRRLEETITFLGGNVEILQGWNVEVVKRESGLYVGMIDTYYFNLQKKKFRDRVEVCCALGLSPPVKTIRSMTREQHFINAAENREKHLLTQQLSLSNYCCDDISYQNDNIALKLSSVEMSSSEGLPLDPRMGSPSSPNAEKDRIYFSLGNVVILDWGEVLSDSTTFNTTSQMFPLGFKCLRQEYDMIFDCVIDCLCEVDGVFETNPSTSSMNMTTDPSTATTASPGLNLTFSHLKRQKIAERQRSGNALSGPLRVSDVIDDKARARMSPLFRITVSWQITYNPIEDSFIAPTEFKQYSKEVLNRNRPTVPPPPVTVIRVYEARSPQQAWQAVMLERLGIDAPVDPSETKPTPTEARTEASPEEGMVSTDWESGDEEELALRTEIRDQRRAYFRALRSEQSQGQHAAVKPRLALEILDTFCEDIVVRLVEGMRSSFDCRGYEYFDAREKENGGKKILLRDYSRLVSKVKGLDRKIRRSSSSSSETLTGVDREWTEAEERREDSLSFGLMSGAGGGGGGSDSYGMSGQKRRRLEMMGGPEQKKKLKEESKGYRERVTAYNRVRIGKIREIEKQIGIFRAGVMKAVRKRRDEVKSVLEVVCEREVSSLLTGRGLGGQPNPTPSLSTGDRLGLASKDRPVPSHGHVGWDGGQFGEVLALWEYLHTFAVVLRQQALSSNPTDQLAVERSGETTQWMCPSLDQLVRATRRWDPILQTVRQATPGVENCFDFVVATTEAKPSGRFDGSDWRRDMTKGEAMEVLETIGMGLTVLLRRDFEKILGLHDPSGPLDASSSLSQGTGSIRIPVNRVTWKEMVRVVLLSQTMKDIGMSDADLAGLLKGRGFFTSPESGDRKALKLTRRRILHQYSVRNEFQEARIGFQSGLILKIPAPSSLSPPYREETVFWTRLQQTVASVDASAWWALLDLIKRTAVLVTTIDPSSHGIELQRQLLQYVSPDGQPQSTSYLTSSSSLKQDLVKLLQEYCVQRGFPMDDLDPHSSLSDMTPRSSLDILQEHLACFQTVAVDRCPEAMSEDKALMIDSKDDPSNELSDQLAVPSSDVKSVEVLKESSTSQAMEDDATQAERLSLAMQRCYLVIRDLMHHPLANPFCQPVAAPTAPLYYQYISQPLSLSQVRMHLVTGGYEGRLFQYYTDIHIVLENALAFNPESSPLRFAAHKLLVVFERLFLETVLCFDSPLPFHDSCHACRSHLPVTHSRAAVCERCEASYHLHCVDPPLATAPRSEWYCLGCIEQKSVASVHPYKTASVVHPVDTEGLGEVVAIEQFHQQLVFVVQFGSNRESWDGVQVRRYAVAVEGEPLSSTQNSTAPDTATAMDSTATTINTTTTAINDTAPALSDTATAMEVSGEAKTVGGRTKLSVDLPTGYEMEDYDRVCALARGYTGWQASHYLLPPNLLENHCRYVEALVKNDDLFDNHRKSLAILNSELGADDKTLREWLIVLKSMTMRALRSPVLSSFMTSLDEATDEETVTHLLNRVHQNSLPIQVLLNLMQTSTRSESLQKPSAGPGKASKSSHPTGSKTKQGEEDKVSVEGLGHGSEDDFSFDGESRPMAGAAEEGMMGMGEKKKRWKSSSQPKGRKTRPRSDSEGLGMGPMGGGLGGEELEGSAVEEGESFYGGSNESKGQDKVDIDEEEDEDEDWFDEEGNCLTSGHSPRPPTTASVAASEGEKRSVSEENQQTTATESEEDWELRLLSRQKGREDALLSHTLIVDVMKRLDIEGKTEEQDGGFPQSMIYSQFAEERPIPHFYSIAVNYVIKSCASRPSETLHPDDWVSSYEMKLKEIEPLVSPEPGSTELSPCCQFCGFDEGYLGSPLVHGFTVEEWLDYHQKEEGPTTATGTAGYGGSSGMDDLEDDAVAVGTSLNEPGTVQSISASTGIKGFRARSKLMKGLVWLPFDAHAARVERQECEGHGSQKSSLLQGGAVVHEFCANFIHLQRGVEYHRRRRDEDQRLVETLIGIGRTKTSPIGSDRHQSLYWIFSGSTSLFVSEQPPSSSNDPLFDRGGGGVRWSVYEEETDIGDLIGWLDKSVESERLLRRILQLLYPNSLTLAEVRAKSASESLGKPSLIESDDASSSGKGDLSEGWKTGDVVLVPSPSHQIICEGLILEQRLSTASLLHHLVRTQPPVVSKYFKVRFPHWGPAYDRWVAEGVLLPQPTSSLASLPNHPNPHTEEKTIQSDPNPTTTTTTAAVTWSTDTTAAATATVTHKGHYWEDTDSQKVSRSEYLHRYVSTAPSLLRTLQAIRFIDEPHRACGMFRPPFTFSQVSFPNGDPVHPTPHSLRMALLIVEAALPMGSIDDAEDRWADRFVESWRESVCLAADPSALMQCQLMLEYGIRTAWLKPNGLKTMSFMPSRLHALRTATYGMVGMRLWILDQTIRYDKIQIEPLLQLSSSACYSSQPVGGEEVDPPTKKGTTSGQKNKAGTKTQRTKQLFSSTTSVEVDFGYDSISPEHTTSTMGKRRLKMKVIHDF